MAAETPRRSTRVGIGDFPRLTRFYGIDPVTLLRTPQWLLAVYADQLRELQAEEALDAITAATYPHAPKVDRDRIWRNLAAKAGYEEPKQRLDPGSQAGKAALAGLGIGLHIDSSQEQTDDA